jgi:uncharacterized protein YukE
MSNFLDANTAQLASSSAAVQDATVSFVNVLHQAEGTAAYAQAMNQGEASLAFQQSHARFVNGSTKLQGLLQMAGVNVGEAGTDYTATDSLGASNLQSVPISDGGDISIRA